MSRGYPSLHSLACSPLRATRKGKIAKFSRLDKKPGAATQGGIGGLLDQLRAVLACHARRHPERRAWGNWRIVSRERLRAIRPSSWVGTGPNKPVTPTQLAKQTGLSRNELARPIVSRTSRRR